MIPKNIAYSALPLLLAALAAPSIAADKPAPAEKEETKKDDSAVAPVEEQAMPSRGSVTVAGKLTHYTATPGTSCPICRPYGRWGRESCWRRSRPIS